MSARFIFYLVFYIISLAFVKDIFSVYLTFPIFLIILYNVLQIKDRNVSLEDAIHILTLAFFVMGPLHKIDNGKIGIGSTVSAANYFESQMIIAMTIVVIFYAIITFMLRYRGVGTINLKFTVFPKVVGYYIFAAAIISFLIYVSLVGGVDSVVVSRYDRVLARESQTSDSLAALLTVNSGIFAMCAILLATQVRARIDEALIMFMIVLMLVILRYNPLNAARFSLLAVYIPMLMVFFKGRIKTISFYSGIVVLALVIFPVLSISTRFGLEGFSANSHALSSSSSWLEGIDVFDTLVECVRYVQIYGHDYGLKLLAIITIFIPRAWWPDKPFLGGLDVGNNLMADDIYGTANVSLAVMADGYMDFGFAGVVFVSIVVGLLIRTFVSKRRYFVNGHDIFSYVLFANLPILYRGPLGAVLFMFLFQILALVVIRKLFGKNVQPPPGLAVARYGLGPPEIVQSRPREISQSARRMRRRFLPRTPRPSQQG